MPVEVDAEISDIGPVSVTAVIEHYSVNVNVKVLSVKGIDEGHVFVCNASIL